MQDAQSARKDTLIEEEQKVMSVNEDSPWPGGGGNVEGPDPTYDDFAFGGRKPQSSK